MTNINKSLILSAIIATIATVMIGALSTTLQSANAQEEVEKTNVKAKQKLKQDCEEAGCQQSACIIVGENTATNACRQQD
jgi:hypothetical protein